MNIRQVAYTLKHGSEISSPHLKKVIIFNTGQCMTRHCLPADISRGGGGLYVPDDCITFSSQVTT